MRLRRRAVRFVGGSLDGETTLCGTPLVYLRVDVGFEEYERDGRLYVFRGVTTMRNPGIGASTTLERRPAFVLVPV